MRVKDRVLGRMLTSQVKKSARITAKGFHPAPSSGSDVIIEGSAPWWTRSSDGAAHEGPFWIERPRSEARAGRSAIGATSSLPDPLAKVPSQTGLPTFVIVRCQPAVC